MDSEVLFNILKVAGLFIGLSFIVFWVGLVWWVSQDILTRTNDKIIMAAAVAMTAILGPVGVMFYLIIRPKQTLKESYGEMMEHEMMLRAAASTICPMCEHMTQEDFVNCPFCGTVLKKQCAECQKLVNMDWSYCPYCGQVAEKPVSRPAIETPSTTMHLEALQELKTTQQLEAIKQDELARLKIEQGQKTSFSTVMPLPSLGQRQRVAQASQSALGMLKQMFATTRPYSTDMETKVVSEVHKGEAEMQTAPQTSAPSTPPAHVDASVAKKRPAKGRATRRGKK